MFVGWLSEFFFLREYVLPLFLVIVHNDFFCFSDLQLKVKLFKPCGFGAKFLRVFKRFSLLYWSVRAWDRTSA